MEDSELKEQIAKLTRSKGQTIDNDKRILVPLTINEISALIAEEVRKAKIEAYRNIPDYRKTIMDDQEITLEKWLWKEIDKLEAELKAEGED